MHARKGFAGEEVFFECARCHYKALVTGGTIFEHTRTPYVQMILNVRGRKAKQGANTICSGNLSQGDTPNKFYPGVKVMCVITISRQIGSSGSEIGKKVAQKLGYHLVDKKALA